MCGIAGIISFSGSLDTVNNTLQKILPAIEALKKRGPDTNGYFFYKNIALGHTRLKVIDKSDLGAQPMLDLSERYTIVFNGEIYNYKEHRKILEQHGVQFKSQSDTEVLLHLYIREKEKCLDTLDGEFAFVIFDRAEHSLFFARDRMGVKPLLMYCDTENFMFASELKALLAMGILKDIDYTSLFTYLQLNYISGNHSILKRVYKVPPGLHMKITCHDFLNPPRLNGSPGSEIVSKAYYIPPMFANGTDDYPSAQKKLAKLLNESVERRLVSDVPLGIFLSGGIDSSVITALAANHTKTLNTFSIGYKDEPFFDETRYAQLVSKKYNTNHTVFSLTNNDLFEHLYETLNYIDEPFADSSALAVNILSGYARKHVTVALSGDGADEIFSGYNKHSAEWMARNPTMREKIVKFLYPLWKLLPKSRHSKFGNTIRQLHRFADGMQLPERERYWRWTSFMSETDAEKLLTAITPKHKEEFAKRKTDVINNIKKDFNSVLFADACLVLPNDMLFKVDLMSMAHGLEVRIPFLDYHIVDYVFSLPAKYKIDRKMRKKILQDAFRHMLPSELYNRPKHGFEVPLLRWFKTEMRTTIENDLLNEKFIREQNIFSADEINKLKAKLFSNNPEDTTTHIWNLLVFQRWWRKYYA